MAIFLGGSVAWEEPAEDQETPKKDEGFSCGRQQLAAQTAFGKVTYENRAWSSSAEGCLAVPDQEKGSRACRRSFLFFV